jgi:dTDP-4-amino-4,6-dideoxygalactose transaminase
VALEPGHQEGTSVKVPAASIYFPEEDRRAILAAMDEALRSGQLTLGKHGKAFEEAFAARVGAAHAVAVNSGTSALEIILRILGVAGREVVVPTNTFFASAAAVLHAEGRVRFADVDPDSLCLSARTLLEALTPSTAGVMVVHIGGLIAPDIEALAAVCRDRGLWLLEDAAHAHGSTAHGRHAGTFGRAGSFSFYPTKVMTSGEGGMIVTDDAAVAEEARTYRDQGKAGFTANVHTRLGSNWRLSEPHAILGASQLRRLDEFVAARRHIAAIYDAGLREIPGATPLAVPAGFVSNYYKYIVVLPRRTDRAGLKQRLREAHGVSLSGEVYELPCHEQPVFAAAAGDQKFPVAEDLCRRHICLPVSAVMTDEQARHVVDALRRELQG